MLYWLRHRSRRLQLWPIRPSSLPLFRMQASISGNDHTREHKIFSVVSAVHPMNPKDLLDNLDGALPSAKLSSIENRKKLTEVWLDCAISLS